LFRTVESESRCALGFGDEGMRRANGAGLTMRVRGLGG